MSRYAKKQVVSPETEQEALNVAKQTQRPGQTKEQTRVIAQGIQKGIEQYKKQQKVFSRQRDKIRKKALKREQSESEQIPEKVSFMRSAGLPWLLLLLSWSGFFGVLFLGDVQIASFNGGL